MIIEKDIKQGTPEWNALRAGIPTASGFDKIVTTKGEPSKQRQKYLYQLSAERVTGIKEDSYQNAIMQRGIEMEEEGRGMYELMTGNDVSVVGFCYRDKKKLYGCSPDGLIGDDGVLEIKSPLSYTHVGYLLKEVFPMDYFAQVQGQLFVTGRKYVDFFSYYPGIKPMLIRVEPDKKFIGALQVELEIFCEELDKITEKLRSV